MMVHHGQASGCNGQPASNPKE